MYECICSCGSGLVSYVRREALIGKSVRAIRSCGCLQIEAAKQNKSNVTHGLSKHPLYKVRSNMIKRCYQSRNSAYSRYGARGIEICDAWLEDFRAFYSWVIEQGWTLGITIDRIDNDGPYAPENCQLLSRAKNALKMQNEHERAFFIAGQQVNINELSKNSRVSADLCKKLLSNCYSQADVFAYGQLELHQKNAVSRYIYVLKDMGPKPELKRQHAIDRIDPHQDYCPKNCRWILSTENSRRVRKLRNITKEADNPLSL